MLRMLDSWLAKRRAAKLRKSLLIEHLHDQPCPECRTYASSRGGWEDVHTPKPWRRFYRVTCVKCYTTTDFILDDCTFLEATPENIAQVRARKARDN